MLLHICFVDYHSEMKFEQLLKIICKRYFLLYFIIPLLHPPVPLFVGREGSDGRGHNVNRHTELLWCWFCFQNIFWGLIPIAGSWVFILFCFHIVLLVLKHLSRYLRRSKMGRLMLDFNCSRRKFCDMLGNIHWHCLSKGRPGEDPLYK